MLDFFRGSQVSKCVYFFGNKEADGNSAMKALLGGKGANLAEMSSIGLPVPCGFTVTTEVCNQFYDCGGELPKEIEKEIMKYLERLEKKMGQQLGSTTSPLLVSVRSGGRSSMPGMMDTILNLGLNDETVEALCKSTNNPRFAYDSYRRLIQMYGNVVLEIAHEKFEHLLSLKKRVAAVNQDMDLSAVHLKELADEYKKCIEEEGLLFPQDAHEQLINAIHAVFKSWMNPRAQKYRQIHNIPQSWGTAVNVQAMVFGNLGHTSATGVCFTRDPSTGENSFYGEYLINAQGEDVVAGIRTPAQITKKYKEQHGSPELSMEETMPEVFKQLCDVRERLEKHYKEMQDIEFTVQDKKLWVLQTRTGKRSAIAALKIVTDMVKENLITKEEAIERVDPAYIDQLLHPALDPNAKNEKLTRGLPASPGAASGKVVFSPAEAESMVGEKVILVRTETSPEDIGGMNAAQGILTARGGMTSHAAVVARGMGKPCVCGASEVVINESAQQVKIGNLLVKKGEFITIDGSSGYVYAGSVATVMPDPGERYQLLMQWVGETKTLGVRANADTPHDARIAREFGAEGIGLCRTEHMFFNPERILAVREMIIADTVEAREKALAKILPYQRDDFIELFQIMNGLPVTIRLLDPPLHEFLPKCDEDLANLSKSLNVGAKVLKQRVQALEESNPMLGHRGCRLAITFPEIYKMQVQAILEAAGKVGNIKPEIMVPLVLDARELEIIKKDIADVAEGVRKNTGLEVRYSVGTMIELPRAALCAEEIARYAEFFSFGTNDLTQTTMGISRDDSGKFLRSYIDHGIFEQDPFVALDQNGVGELIKFACTRGAKSRPDIKLGICGEHGGHPQSIEFFHRVGLDYVSCSPYRIPIARLAAAQARIKDSIKRKISVAA